MGLRSHLDLEPGSANFLTQPLPPAFTLRAATDRVCMTDPAASQYNVAY